MDRFKFRVWDGQQIHNDVSIDGNGKVHVASKRGFHTDGIKVMQCTGLKDKNGKLIFEKDIVRFRTQYTNKPHATVGEICWDDYKLIIKANGFEYSAEEETDEFPYTCEVIGNTLENPELLNVH